MTPDIVGKVKFLINKGIRPFEISKLLNINNVTLLSWAHKNGYKFCPNKGNVHYFDNIDSYAKAYIVGFIAADGALVKTKTTTTLTITIKYEDKAILEFIKSEIGNSHELKEIIRPNNFDKSKMIYHIRYTISDKNITLALNNLGIYSNKSLTIGNVIENIPYQFRDAFIIGFFDGNGSVIITDKFHFNKDRKTCGKYYPDHTITVDIRSTKALLSGICNHLNISENHIHQYDSTPKLTITHKKDVCKFFKCYKHLPFFLKRKHDKFLQRINHPSYDKYKQDQTISSSIE